MRLNMKYSSALMLVLLSLVGMSQIPSPGKKNTKKVLVRYATAHVGNGEKIENAYLAFNGDEITMLANGNNMRINVLDYDSIIDAEGKHIYPGFIIMDSRLGLTEIDQVNATHDFNETGMLTPNVRALPAFNAESKVVSTVRTNGILMAQIAPSGGVLSGTSACVHFDGWNWKDAAVRGEEGVYLNWPSRYGYRGWWAEPGSSKENKKYEEQQRQIYDYFAEARAYSVDSSQQEQNLRFESMRGLYSGSKRLYVRVNWAKDILDVVQFLRQSGIENYAIAGGAEAHLVTTELKENHVPVIIDRVHKLPAHEDDPLYKPFELASQLVEAGVEVAFATSGDMEAMISRNLPFQVGTAVHHGLEYEKAIQCITQVPAKLMGIEENYGTIESGKKATFFISSGDALDITTNNVEAAFVDGRPVDLNNSQIELYKKYSKR
ncbi:MAG: amidohydrolase family protein [Flavobacteriales bacterium]